MTHRSLNLLLIALSLMSNCDGVESSPIEKSSMTYHLKTPRFTVEYQIPAILQEGYGGIRTEITLTNPDEDQFAGAIGEGAFSKGVGTFYLGAVDDFKRWDVSFDIIVIKFDRLQRPVNSVTDLAAFIKQMFSTKIVLHDGTAINYLDSISVQRIGMKDIVIAISSERRQVSTVILASGASTERLPFEFYYLLVDDQWAIGIGVYHDNPRAVNEEMFKRSRTIVNEIIDRMKITLTTQK